MNNATIYRPTGFDRLLAVCLWLLAGGLVAFFLWLLMDLILGGAGHLSWDFLATNPRNAGRAGGIFPIIVSTLLILAVTLAVSLPLGLGGAIFLSEFAPPRSVSGRLVRLALDILAGIPSIVFGLFGNAFFCIYLGMGFSILSGGLTLACMVLPLLIRTTEAGLRAVPDSWRMGAAALGLSRQTTTFRLILPAAAPALVAGMVLGIGRALAETAALIFTSGYVDRMPSSVWDSGRALSIHIYDLSMNISGGNQAAYASALTLIVLLLVINGCASFLIERSLARHHSGIRRHYGIS